ncbi:MAG: HTH-type transcriptional regulator / antitoxin HigA [uncultured Aureispira sp.]|uniref:HTH-type transcriptional regulator / antitoxin HigA n=1 Tax=uncultured Aureispira sp. TaxID=1331704 RepID=A0A6S6THV7_9BACT|nr:MAG: HTH-type transcriptional regulator / antitoxin HigA [uncultured Aureispira sp.]
MEIEKLLVIKTDEQYFNYCDLLEKLATEDEEKYLLEIETLEILIEDWDKKHSTVEDLDPIDILKGLMKSHKIKQVELANMLNISESYMSNILAKRKGISKNVIYKLSKQFKMSQDAFNRPFQLVNELNKSVSNANLMNTTKDMSKYISETV